jgi:type II secretory pathway pseudopilin PulG
MKTLREKPLAPGTAFAGFRSVQGVHRQIPAKRTGPNSAFTLAETLVSIVIMGICFSTVLMAYTRASQYADWSGASLAAQALSLRQLEQFRAVVWDTQVLPILDDTTNIPKVLVLPLNLPIAGTNVSYATNTATVTNFNLSGTASFKMITVTTTWAWMGQTFNNKIVAYRAPDQ